MSKYNLPTFTGKIFNLQNPTEDMICIEDIAHHLSIENRYNGAIKFPYSVAYHSVLVCQQAEEKFKLEALLHDAEEAYYKDWPAALKNLIGRPIYEQITHQFNSILKDMYQLSSYYKTQIKEIDLRMGATEIAQLLPYYGEKYWAVDRMPENREPFANVNILNLSAANVEELFLKEFEKLRRDK